MYEILALLVVLFGGIKIVLSAAGKKYVWFNDVTKKAWNSSVRMTAIALVMTLVSLYVLLQEFTIVQIFAVTFFALSLTWLGLAPFSPYMLELEEKIFKDLNRRGLGIIAGAVWAILFLWVLYEILV